MARDDDTSRPCGTVSGVIQAGSRTAVASICERGLRTRDRTLDETIRALEDYVRLFECQYGRTSRSMADAVARGRFAETAEISTWLTRYGALVRLRDRSGNETGIGTPTT